MGNQFSKVTSKEIIGSIYQALESGGNTGWLEALSLRTTSDSASNHYGWLGQAPKMREWKGSRQAKQLLEHDYTIRNKKFESTLRVELDDLDRDKTGQLDRRIGELSAGSDDNWVELVSDLLQNYSSYTCYDGSAFFAAHSAEGESGSTTNLLTATQAPGLDVTTATAPTAAECTIALLDIIAYMMTFKDDQGRPINRNMKAFTVICGNTKLYSPLLQATLKDLIVSGGAATDNILSKTGYTFNVVMNPWLTASSWTTTFVVARADAPIPPFILQQEKDIEVKSLAEGSDFEFDEDSWLFGTKAKRNVGYGFYQYAAHCTLS